MSKPGAGLRVSVVLCTYQGARYLPAQWESLLAQQRLPEEIVVCDDASQDASWSISQTYARSAEALGIDVRMQRHAANVGYVENFSQALRLASGDVLFLCDQDDIWRPDKISTMSARFAADAGLCLLHTNARLVDGDGHPNGVSVFESLQVEPWEMADIHAGHAFRVLLRRSMVTGATVALRPELLQAALPVGQDWIHDEWLAIIAAAVGRVDVLEEPLIDYRQHATNQIGARRRTLADKWQDMVRPRGAFFRQEVRRMELLHERLSALAVQPALLAQLTEKQAHYQYRVQLGEMPRRRRFRPIWREARSGRYGRFGTGVRSMLRDLLRYD